MCAGGEEEGGREEGGREEGGREERGREGEREGWREGEGGRDGEREGWREGEGGREDRWFLHKVWIDSPENKEPLNIHSNMNEADLDLEREGEGGHLQSVYSRLKASTQTVLCDYK